MMLAASPGPAIVRASSLMKVRPILPPLEAVSAEVLAGNEFGVVALPLRHGMSYFPFSPEHYLAALAYYRAHSPNHQEFENPPSVP